MKKIITIFIFIFPLMLLGNDFQSFNIKNSNLTQGNVQMKLKVGTTLKSDVLEDFGAPNITTRDGKGYEVWTYQRSGQEFTQEKDDQGFWLLLFSNSSQKNKSASSSRMTTIIMKFDENDILYDYRSRSSNF